MLVLYRSSSIPSVTRFTVWWYFTSTSCRISSSALVLHESLTSPHTFSRNRRGPLIPSSRKSPPSWNGPRNIRYIRNVSAPQRAMYSSGTTTLPRDFDILAPSFTISPCARNFRYGSSKCRWPRSCSTIVMNRA